MVRYTCRKSIAWAIAVLLGYGAVLCAPSAYAASEDTLLDAGACVKLDWRNKGGYERAKTYREAVDCFKVLYIRVAGGTGSNEAFKKELAKRLNELEAAYLKSRSICDLQKQMGIHDENCGTIGLSSHEFIVILKTMILNEDAGWKKKDPALAKALHLDE